MIAQLSFWCHIRKQMISPSTQIIGEKPQTVSGPLWVIVHLRVELALVMVSHAIRRVIYAARLRIMGLQHGGQLGGRGGSKWLLPLSLFLHINLRPASLGRGGSFCYAFQVVLKHRGSGGRMEGGSFGWSLSQTVHSSVTSFHYLCAQTFLMGCLIFAFAAWMQRGRRGRGEANSKQIHLILKCFLEFKRLNSFENL